MHQVHLPLSAGKKLLAQDPRTERNGGFQKLLVELSRQYDPQTETLKVSQSNLEKIERYRKNYGGGGWQSLLRELSRKASLK